MLVAASLATTPALAGTQPGSSGYYYPPAVEIYPVDSYRLDRNRDYRGHDGDQRIIRFDNEPRRDYRTDNHSGYYFDRNDGYDRDRQSYERNRYRVYDYRADEYYRNQVARYRQYGNDLGSIRIDIGLGSISFDLEY